MSTTWVFHWKCIPMYWSILRTGSILTIYNWWCETCKHRLSKAPKWYSICSSDWQIRNSLFPVFPVRTWKKQVASCRLSSFCTSTSHDVAALIFLCIPSGFSPNYIDQDWRQSQNISVGLLAFHISNWYRTQVKKRQKYRQPQVRCGQVQLVSHKDG